jgi:hypothetical protein
MSRTRRPLPVIEGADPQDGKGLIYAMIDPRNGFFRYIGQTTGPLAKRLDAHYRQPGCNP